VCRVGLGLCQLMKTIVHRVLMSAPQVVFTPTVSLHVRFQVVYLDINLSQEFVQFVVEKNFVEMDQAMTVMDMTHNMTFFILLICQMDLLEVAVHIIALVVQDIN